MYHFHDQGRGPAESSSSRPFNPAATDFTPKTRLSSKRKASSSVAPTSPSEQGALQASTPAPVYVKADQLFERNSSPKQSRAEIVDESEDSDEDAMLMDQRFRGSLPTYQLLERMSSTTSSAKSKEPRRSAVLLVQSEGHAGSSTGQLQHTPRQVRYLPLYPSRSNSGNVDYSRYMILPDHADRIRRKADSTEQPSRTATWPSNTLPVELFEQIAEYLDRDDIKLMRLVNREFERKMCKPLFRTSVVPFNTELYDMIIDESKTNARHSLSARGGKGKKRTTDGDNETWAWRNAKEDKEDKVYRGHGLRVFQGFGPHIKRFGMSFEVSDSLSLPPGKQLLDPVDAYHGTYEWPTINYARFAKLNRLEETADETSRMKMAFSNLKNVIALGLSVRNGLGWLEGPDKSFRTRLLQRPEAVFGGTRESKDRLTKSAREVLSALRQCILQHGPSARFKEITLEESTLKTPLDKLFGPRGTSLADTQVWSRLHADVFKDLSPGMHSEGIKVLSANTGINGAHRLGDIELNPNDLKREQKEWLLETEWAQRAFLESYILAVMDNPNVFSKVTNLNLAAISSAFLPLVSREMFWDALPAVTSVEIHISPDWRIVQKDEAACAETKMQNPSEAVRGFCDLLANQVSERANITKLTFGWADGGEHANGMFARNANLLPAPISLLDQSTVLRPTNLLVFPYVEHLTISNCWITPPMLENFINFHSTAALRKLTLDSISLTSYPMPGNAQQAQAAAAAVAANFQGFFQQNAAAAMNAPGLAQHQPAIPPFPVMNNQQQLAWQQFNAAQLQMQQHMHQMQQMFAAVPGPIQAGMPAPPGLQPHPANFGWNQPVPQNPQGPFMQHQQHHPVNSTYWTDGHRQGSWPHLLNRISPGPIFTDYLPEPQPWEQQRPPRPTTNLQTLELTSCGYAKLDHNNSFDQIPLMLDADGTRERMMLFSPWFRARAAALKPYMLDGSGDKFLGSIAQWMPQREVDALHYAWGLRMGWEDAEKAEEAEFDGFLAGGTGRVSGVIEKGMPLMTHHLPPAAPG